MEIVTLSNGLRVVCAHTDGNVAHIGIYVQAGSREDGPNLGLAHFVEHTIFKGTTTLNSCQLSKRLEIVGGDFNAYTSKEEICLYCKVPGGYEQRAIKLMADMVTNATFPEDEVEMERGVVLEEIDSYRDNLSFAVFDEFDEHMLAGNSNAHNVLGYADTVREIDRQTTRSFLERWFNPANMTAYCLTPGDPAKALKLLEKWFGAIDRRAESPHRTFSGASGPFDKSRNTGRHQAHTIVGCPLFGRHDDRRFAATMLLSILTGSGMSSRLNQELRDRRGLVYSVESVTQYYQDSGTFGVYFACDPKNTEKCTRIIKRELSRLADRTLAPRTFTQLRDQLRGLLLVATDSRTSDIKHRAKTWLAYGTPMPNTTTAERVGSLTPEDLRSVAELIVSTPHSRLTLS